MAPVSDRELHHHIRGLKATRAYAADPLPERDLLDILEAGRWSGSSLNSQPWTFVVVTDPQTKSDLSETGRYAAHLSVAPAVIVLVGAPGRGDFDLGRAAQNMMLVADAAGIGSCPATLHDEESARRILGVPDDRSARHALAFGYPDHEHEATVRQNMKLVTGSARKPLSEVARWDRYA